MKISAISFNGQPVNFHVIDKNVMRSAQPMREDFIWIKENGVTDVINFRTLYVPAVDFDEKVVVESLGMQYHQIPSITAKPEISNIKKFLSKINDIKTKNGIALIHCKSGVDRTGMYAFIYKMKNNLGTMETNIAEWKAYGMHIDRFPNLIEKTKEILNNL